MFWCVNDSYLAKIMETVVAATTYFFGRDLSFWIQKGPYYWTQSSFSSWIVSVMKTDTDNSNLSLLVANTNTRWDDITLTVSVALKGCIAAMLRLLAEASRWTSSQTFGKYESSWITHQIMHIYCQGLKILESPYNTMKSESMLMNVCMYVCSTYSIPWIHFKVDNT